MLQLYLFWTHNTDLTTDLALDIFLLINNILYEASDTFLQLKPTLLT